MSKMIYTVNDVEGVIYMNDFEERHFMNTYRLGAIRSVTLRSVANSVVISYQTQTGEHGTVTAKRGHAKRYQHITALQLLKSLGCNSVTIDMSGWIPGQFDLLG
jgi:hypothetical protein